MEGMGNTCGIISAMIGMLVAWIYGPHAILDSRFATLILTVSSAPIGNCDLSNVKPLFIPETIECASASEYRTHSTRIEH